MATWFPISGSIVQRITASGLPASGYVLKLYTPGTTTNIPLATDSTGATQANYAVYNATGDVTVSGNTIIPHINTDYKLCIYPTQAAADADSGATLSIDNIALSTVNVTIGTLGGTTVGTSFFQLTNPSAITFPRINANNTVTALTAAAMRAALGSTTIGDSLFGLTNPSAVTFPRLNADNTATALSAANFRTAIGSTTIGDSFFALTNPSAVTFPRMNADNSVSALSAGAFLAAIGGSTLGISTVTTATTATTLTSTKTLLKITPASYGVRVTFADATTCSVGGPQYIVDNSHGAYPVMACNNAGTLLGFVPAGVVSICSLDDISTAAGVWACSGLERVGASAQLLTTNMNVINGCIALDSDRDFLIAKGASNYCYGAVYRKSTNTFSNVTAIRSAAVSDRMACVLQTTNQVLVVSCDATTGFEAVICSVNASTDAITVNTAATATLSANISNWTLEVAMLIAVGSSFVVSYRVATPACQIRALSVSGTTVTIGAATVLSGTSGSQIAGNGPFAAPIVASGSVVICASTATTHLYVTPYTVSGSTLSIGTGTDTNSGTMYLTHLAALGTRWFVGYNDGGTTPMAGIASLSSTTITITTATGFSAGNYYGGDAILVGTTKVLLLNNQTTNNANIITDSAGTASAGTAITLSGETARVCLYSSGTDVAVQEGTANYYVQMVDCSGASPVLTSTQKLSGTQYMSEFTIASTNLMKSAAGLYGSSFAEYASPSDNPTTHSQQCRVSSGVASNILSKLPHISTPATRSRGTAESNIWAANATTVIQKWECA